MHMPRCTQLTVDLLRSIVDSIAAVQGQDDLWLCHPAVTAVCCVRWFHLWPGKCGSDVYLCLPACVSINTCACVCVCVLKFEHEIEQRGSNGKFTRTAQGQLNQQAREEGGRRVTGLGDGRMIFTCAVDGGRRHRHIFGSACVLSAQLESSRWKALTFPLTASESGSAKRSTLRPI